MATFTSRFSKVQLSYLQRLIITKIANNRVDLQQAIGAKSEDVVKDLLSEQRVYEELHDTFNNHADHVFDERIKEGQTWLVSMDETPFLQEAYVAKVYGKTAKISLYTDRGAVKESCFVELHRIRWVENVRPEG